MHVNAHGAYISPNCTVADTNDQKLKDISKNGRDETTWIEDAKGGTNKTARIPVIG